MPLDSRGGQKTALKKQAKAKGKSKLAAGCWLLAAGCYLLFFNERPTAWFFFNARYRL
jgi:hypothetical protein